VGQTADRYDRRVIVALCRVASAIAAATLAVGTLGGELTAGRILALVAVVGAARTFESPATTALVASLVARPLVPAAMAWSVSATQAARIVSPALGGVLYVLGAEVVYLAVASLFLIAALLAAFIRAPNVQRDREELTLDSFLSGILYIRNSRLLLGMMSLDLFAVLFGGATALLPIYARDVLHTGPWGLGLLRSAPAVGALATSIVLARYPIDRQVGRVMLRAVVVFGAATVVFGASTHLALSLLALAVLGASDVVSVVIRASLVQLRTPDAMRGRVSAVHSLFTGTSNQLGEFESGLAATLFGVVPAVLIGGLGTIIVAVVWTYFFPELRRVSMLER
ncbi:MAG TPA: MFS transporter, partial [Candidatus Acidoferrum sp.]|nr:MFS transporter [Candidatus Acidoferrum sp.]